MTSPNSTFALGVLTRLLAPKLAPLLSLVSVELETDGDGYERARFEGNAAPGAPFAYGITLEAREGYLSASYEVLEGEKERPDNSEDLALAYVFGLDPEEGYTVDASDESDSDGPGGLRALSGLVLSRVAALYAVGGSFREAAYPFGGEDASLYGYPKPGTLDASGFPAPDALAPRPKPAPEAEYEDFGPLSPEETSALNDRLSR